MDGSYPLECYNYWSTLVLTSNQDISSDKKNKTAMEEKKREKEKK